VSADLTKKETIEQAIEGCEYVLHVASPFPSESPKNDDELVKPAVEGTVAVLEACDTHNVKRVVITSSWATIEDFTLGDVEINEDHIAKIEKFQTPYVKSKIYAEESAFKTIDEINQKRTKEHKDKIEMVIVNPSFIVGPPLIKSDSTSVKSFAMLLEGKYPGIPPYHIRAIDVRDVAEAHIKALKLKPFERYALVATHYKWIESAEWVKEEFGKYGYKPNESEISTFLLWIGSFFDKDANSFYSCANVNFYLNTDKTKKALKMEYRDIKQSIIDMCYKIIELGIVVDKREKEEK
jgi:dihydroflavonol-4-reductase